MCSDPLPPTSVTVTGRTTSSVSVSWQYDTTKSYCQKWKVEYTEKDSVTTETIAIDSVYKKSVTIPSLTAGLTYTIKVFAITSNNVVSKKEAIPDVTISKYHAHLYYACCNKVTQYLHTTD